MGTTAVKERVTSSSFSISIAKGCDAMEAMALYASALLTFPAKWKLNLLVFLSE